MTWSIAMHGVFRPLEIALPPSRLIGLSRQDSQSEARRPAERADATASIADPPT
jgi:hypothetical protein